MPIENGEPPARASDEERSEIIARLAKLFEPERASHLWFFGRLVGAIGVIVGLTPLWYPLYERSQQSRCEPVELSSVQIEVLKTDYRAAMNRMYEAIEDEETDPVDFLPVVAAFEQVLATDPNFPAALVNRGVAYYRVGHLNRAERLLLEAIAKIECIRSEVEKGKPAAAYASWLPAAAGRAETTITSEYFRARLGKDLAGAHYNLACVYAASGEERSKPKIDEAYRSLHKAIDYGFDNYERLLHDGDLHSLRADDRWNDQLSALRKRISE